MSSGSSKSESISECKFETIPESDKESIRGCYNNGPKYLLEEIKWKKRKEVFLKRNVPNKMILGWVTQHGVPIRTASFVRIWTQSPADAVREMLLY